MTFSEWLYRVLLHLYPAACRQEYGALMAQLFRDQYRDAHRWKPIFGPLLLWLRVLSDLVTSLMVEHRDSRKGGMMASTPRVDKVSALVFLLPPLLALFLLFDPNVLRGEWIPYGVAALIGVVGYLLGRIGLIPRLKFWGGYTAGLLIYAVGFFAINIWSPFMNLGIKSSSNGSITNAHTLHIVAGLVAIVLLFLSSKGILKYFSTALVVLALSFAMWLVLTSTPLDASITPSAAWMVGYTATALFVAVAGMRLTRGTGILSLVAVTAGLGLQLTMYMIDEYRGTELTLMILLGAFVPLIVCPAWLLFTQSWRVRKYGLLVIWTLMMVGLFAVPQLLWRAPRPLTINVTLYHIGNCLPIWIGLWLALNIYERESPATAADDDRPLSAARATP